MFPEILYLILFITLQDIPRARAAQDGCHERGVFLQNGTIWHPEPCVQCQCHSSVTVCTEIHCPVPHCPPNQQLVSLPQECCPKCAPEQHACVESAMQFKHGATWSLSPCVDCQCYNGTISCERKMCQINGCPNAHVAVTLDGECCATCVSTGKQCTVESTKYKDGEIWSPMPCTKCQCRNGIVLCYVEQCQAVSCPLNYTLESHGKCCPTCVGTPCRTKDGKSVESGSRWKEDSCTHCTCNAGKINCYKEFCNPVTCPDHQMEVTVKGKCCSACVNKEGWCTTVDGTKVASGTEVNLYHKSCSENEEVRCVCLNGEITCSSVACQLTTCGPGMRLQLQPNTTALCRCPKCVPDMRMCYYDRRSRKDGEIWSVDCRLCGCFDGEISCYIPNCPTCPEGFYAMHGSTGQSSCCPECLPLACPANCLKCSPLLGKEVMTVNGHTYPPAEFNISNPAVTCSACREGHLLQNGQCVDSCRPMMFERSGLCIPCHPSCETCSENTRLNCNSCRLPLLLHGGECVDDCGVGFYPKNYACHPCHSSCQECSDKSAADCQVCHRDAKLLNESCVDDCPAEYVAREGVCEKCSPHCKRCGANECLECHFGYVIQNKKCVANCSDGYYEESRKICLACHPSCLTCSGPGISSCTSCPHSLIQVKSLCLATCPPATFRKGNKCVTCHESCSECAHDGENGCLRCKDIDYKILSVRSLPLMASNFPNNAQNGAIELTARSSGPCVPSCPEHLTLINGVCVESSVNCEEGHSDGSNFCRNCSQGFLLQNNSCVKKCSPGFYPNVSLCLECSPHCSTCSSDGSNACSSCPPWAKLYNSTSRLSMKALSKCLTKCRKGYFFYPKHSSCQACHESCEDCATTFPTEVSVCVQCKEKTHFIEGEKCVEKCSLGSYFSEEKNRCNFCHPLCKSCTGPAPDQCSTCSNNITVTNKGRCEATPCENGLSISVNGSCTIKCAENCYTCDSNDSSVCTSCKYSNHFLLLGKCVEQCPPKFYNFKDKCEECHGACRDCVGSTPEDCIQCETSFKRQENSCVASCFKGYYELGDECHPCYPGCKHCSSDINCTACEAPYFLEDGMCVPSCKTGTVPNVWKNWCVACKENCKECSMSLECTECQSPFLIQNGLCTTKCDHNNYPNADNSKCLYNVDSPKLFISDTLKVDYQSTAVLNSSLIRVFDMDSPREKLFLIVIEPPSNIEMFFLENGQTKTKLKRKSIIGLPALDEGRVLVRHTVSSPFSDLIKLRVSDGHFESQIATLVINVVSRFSPEIIRLEPLLVRKGGEGIITEDYLKIRDIDNEDTVVINALYGPSSGNLRLHGKDVTQFTIKNLEELQVTYEYSVKKHSLSIERSINVVDLNSYSDSILFQAGDGYNYVNFIFNLVLVDSSHPTPVLVKNKGAKVQKRHKVQITKDVLQAKDVDSLDGNIIYSFLPSTRNPSSGSLVLVIPLPSTPNGFFNDGWTQMDESHLLRPTTSFTQKDIDEGRVWYVHSNDDAEFTKNSPGLNGLYRGELAGDEYSTEQLVFSVSDSSNPPNILKDQTFIIQIEANGIAESMMEFTSDSNLGITVLEGQAVTITPSHMKFSGIKSNDHLVYTISHPLGQSDGSLFHIDSPGLELRQFTQSDINDMKIIYMPPLDSIGDEERIISFKFTISGEIEGKQSKLPEQKFTIRILPLKEEMAFLHPDPEVIVSSLGTVELDSKYFQLTSTPEEMVAVFLLEAPLHGSLSLIRSGDGKQSEIFSEETELTLREIMESRILYSNDGSESLSDSALILALSHASEATTRINFKVQLSDNSKPSPHKNATFALHMKEGETKIISPKILYFTDFHSDDEELAYTLSSQPFLGNFLLMDSKGNLNSINRTDKLKQIDISSGRLSFTSNVETGLDVATERLFFNVTDVNNNALTNQILKIVIDPVDNQPPSFSVNGKVNVTEGSSVIIPSDIVTFLDIDSTLDMLTLVVDVPPLFGYITNSLSTTLEQSYQGNSASLFMSQYPLKDLLDGKLTYVQSQHRHKEPTRDSFVVHLTDGNNPSKTQEFKILIEPTNDESPVILGEQVSVERGGTVNIQNVSLFISDADTEAKDLIITIEQAPQHGTLHKKKTPASSFKDSISLGKGEKYSFYDIVHELVFYSHDGSKATKDFMEISVSDGDQETGGILEFLVRSQVVKTPRLSTNNGLKVKVGHTVVIPPSALSATDEDSSINDLSYVIDAPAQFGEVQVYDEKHTKWKTVPVGSNFQQRDINLEHIRYAHTKISGKERHDQINFHLQDGEGNILLDQIFNVTLEPDSVPPRITTNKGLNVSDHSLTGLTVDFLSSTDSEVDPMTVSYKVVSPPSLGHFEFASVPGKSITSWTQEDLELGNLGFRHTSEKELSSENIQLIITDGSNFINESILVNVLHIDEIPPYLILKSVKVQSGSRKNITHYEIKAEDPDTKDELLTFNIEEAPKFGTFQLYDNEETRNVKSFSMRDIDEGKVSYLHYGNSIQSDNVMLTVSDPSNKGYLYKDFESPITESSLLKIDILSVSVGTPIISANGGLRYLEHSGGKAKNAITSYDLSVTDNDSTPDNLTFRVTKLPMYGVLRLNTHERPISTFTQSMINDGILYYELTTFDEAFTEDEFIFDVSDSSSNVVSGNIFHIQWAWLFMAKKEYNVSEPDGIVQVFVKRTGNMNQNSNVKCSVQETTTKERNKRKTKHGKQKEDKDFVPLNLELQFDQDSTEKYCEIAIRDDAILEGKESFTVRLTDAKYSLIGKPKKSIVNIRDNEDQPSLYFESSQYIIKEEDGFIFVPVKRKGDVKVLASVMCVTKDISAVGSETAVDSPNADYVKKLTTRNTSKVVFPSGVTISTCDVKLIDDGNFELKESFELYLQDPSEGVTLGDINKTIVIIEGPNDQSELAFERNEIDVKESSGKIDVKIKRTGTDVSNPVSVWCASRSFSSEDAKANIDFIPFSREIKFERDQIEAIFSVTIIDDSANPRYEGPERFSIFMSTPQNASLNLNKTELVVIITDEEDVPRIQFEATELKVNENDTILHVPVIRSGDLSGVSYVYCFTRQKSAKGGLDYTERPDDRNFILTFPIGVSKVDCEVGILDDLIFEKQEEFLVKLSNIQDKMELQPFIGPNKVVRVHITDLEDRPQITFKDEVYTTAEPKSADEITYLVIPILRNGDVSQSSNVRVSTENVAALAGIDYQPINKVVEFPQGIRRVEIKLGIFHNPSRQWNKSLKVLLHPEQCINCDLGYLKSISVTIIDHHVTEASVYPSSPTVVSLLHYDTAREHNKEPASPGYPLVCIAACQPNHPEYRTMMQICDQANFNSSSKTKISWDVAVPEEGNNLFSQFHSLTDSTLFASTYTKVLDSMYFASHFKVRCTIQPVLEGDHLGIPHHSIPISISSSHGICNQPGRNIMRSQNFEAKLTYVNSTDSEHPNSIEISVKIPHQDGMIPLISTIPLHNIRYLLTDILYRTHHSCSNLKPGKGFLHANFSEEKPAHSGSRPYQWDFNLREMKTLNLYRHLDLNSCTWSFIAWYSMSELVESCGGQIVSDFQVGSGGQSFLTARVPFYLSYVYASAAPGWTSLDHRTELSISFYYSTLLWHQGLETKPSLSAKIRVTRMYLDNDGRLVIKLSTTAKFRGQFILRQNDTEFSEFTSKLISPESLVIPFTLELVWSAATWDGPEQIWMASSNYTLKDYTGDYVLQLVPCTVLPSQYFYLSDPPDCVPHRPVNFTLPLAIQQIQQPVPLVYTLNTDFQLINSPELFLTNPREVDNLYEIDYKGNFDIGQTVYGRVLWHPHQDLKSAYRLAIQRVFLCTGANGYIPKYDPTGDIYGQGPLYGCIEESEKLLHRFLILDREVPYLLKENSSIEAYFARDFPEYDVLKTYPGVDGFLFKTDGLYKLNSGYQWFLQVLYTIGPNQRPLRRKRETGFDDDILFSSMETISQLESLPSPEPLQTVHTRNGTNMRGFNMSPFSSNVQKTNSTLSNILYYILIPVIITTFVLVLLVVLLARKYRNRTTGNIVVVRSLKNEREEARRKDEFRISDRCLKPTGSPMTLNSESNLQTVKVKTLAVTVRNNLEEDGTEV